MFKGFLWEWEIGPVDITTDSEIAGEGLYELTLAVAHEANPRTYSLTTYVLEEKDDEEE